MSTSPYTTLGNIRSAIVTDAKEASSTQLTAQLNRWINEGHERIVMAKKRDWLDQQFTVQTSAAVQKTCTVTNNSTTVTFPAGTTFTTANDMLFWNSGFQEIYNIASASNNIIKLSAPYLGPTSTAASGNVFQASFNVDPSIRSIYQVYHQFSNSPLTSLGTQQIRAVQESSGAQLDYAKFYSLFGQTSVGTRKLLVYPWPLVSYTFYVDAQIYCPQLVADTDQPIIPLQYRQILYWYGLYRLYGFHRNMDQANFAYQNFLDMRNRIDAEIKTEIDLPQISVKYSRGRSLKIFSPPFDPNLRNS